MCYNFTNVVTLMNLQKVKRALGVKDDFKYQLCNRTVYVAFKGDWMRNLEVGIPALLEKGIRMLVYAGEEDFICNWLGGSTWFI